MRTTTLRNGRAAAAASARTPAASVATEGIRRLQRRMGNRMLLEHLQTRGAVSVQRQATSDPRTEDPSFLMCLALCELGIPPSLWRTVVREILSAVSTEYEARFGAVRGSHEFESWRAAFSVWGWFNKLKFIIGFLGESRVGLFVIENAAAQAIRRRLLERILGLGVREAGLAVASQILRKVAIYIEIAVAAGCATYCGGTAIASALIEFSQAVASALASFASTLQSIGSGVRDAIGRALLTARATLNPSNWNVSALPPRARAHLGAIGLASRVALTPDDFLAFGGRPLSTYNLGTIPQELAEDINAALRARGGFAAAVTFTADFIRGLTPLGLIDILRQYGLLSFVVEPSVLADRELSAASEPTP